MHLSRFTFPDIKLCGARRAIGGYKCSEILPIPPPRNCAPDLTTGTVYLVNGSILRRRMFRMGENTHAKELVYSARLQYIKHT
jgi:hypothetical protein